MDSARVRTCLDGVCVPCAQRAPRRGKREGFNACLTFAPDGGPPAVLIGHSKRTRLWPSAPVLAAELGVGRIE